MCVSPPCSAGDCGGLKEVVGRTVAKKIHGTYVHTRSETTAFSKCVISVVSRHSVERETNAARRGGPSCVPRAESNVPVLHDS